MVVSNCSSPAEGQFVTRVCQRGTMYSAGSDTKTSICSQPRSSDRWVSEICVPGSYDEIGKDSVTQACTIATKEEFIETPCDPGSPSRLGSDSKRDFCKDYKASTKGSSYCDVCLVMNLLLCHLFLRPSGAIY